MTLDNVQYTATAHTTGGRDGTALSDDGRLDVELSSRNMCSIHHVVELVPGVWKPERLASRSSGNNAKFKEAACPTCLQVAREAFQRQFPALYISATPLIKKSA
jgi:hypothetical protein